VSDGGGVGVDTRRSRAKSYISARAKTMKGANIYLRDPTRHVSKPASPSA
jgi:hypothetical protein